MVGSRMVGSWDVRWRDNTMQLQSAALPKPPGPDSVSADLLECDPPQIGPRMPLVLGGHEHEIFVDEAGQSMIVKVGQDATKIGVCDIWWDAAGELQVRA